MAFQAMLKPIGRFPPPTKKNYITAVGDYINTSKTTFDYNYDLYQAFKQQ